MPKPLGERILTAKWGISKYIDIEFVRFVAESRNSLRRRTGSADIQSKLPDVGTTIFTVMSQLALDEGAINLSQGFPDFDGPEALLDRVEHYLRSGHNQYAPMMGVPSLRQATAKKVKSLYGLTVNPDTEITVTSGATEALFCAISAVVFPGDEVIVLDPAYDSYEPAIALNGGHTVHVPLRPVDFSVDWQRVRDAVTPRTRAIVTNTPHNPTGAVWQPEDMAALGALVDAHGLYVIGDEVYEHIIFDAQPHQSLCRYPGLFERSFVVSSYGKTYHTTGWKIGYAVAPEPLTAEFRKIHQYVTFTSNTFVQLGLADFLAEHPEHHLALGRFYQAKRDYFCGLLADSRFSLTPSAGTYFQLLDYSAITNELDAALAERWTREVKVASIPVSVFCQTDPGTRVLRFCFAKDDATLEAAAKVLSAL